MVARFVITPMIRPLADRVAIKLDTPETESEGGLVLPNPIERLTGLVVAVGPGAKCPHCGLGRPMTVQVDDVVLLAPNTPVHEVNMNGLTLLLVTESQLLGVVDHG